MALIWALGPGQFAVESSPAWLTVALPVHTDAIVGTCWIHAVHWIKPAIHQFKRKKAEKKEINKQTKKCHYRADDKNKLMVVFFLKKTDVTEDIISLCVYKKIMK